MKLKIFSLVVFLFSLSVYCSPNQPGLSGWNQNSKRYWIGPDYWANRLQDWQINNGRLECIGGGNPLRTVHVLTHSLSPVKGDLSMSIRVGVISRKKDFSKNDCCGFLIGAGTDKLDYRADALIHLSSGENGGLIAAIDGTGKISFYDNEKDLREMPAASRKGKPVKRNLKEDIELQLSMAPQGEFYSITLKAVDHKTRKFLNSAELNNIPTKRLTGNIALVSQGGADSSGASFWFRDWKILGSKVTVNKNHAFGPIFSAMYTLSKGILKLTAQMPPVAKTDPQTVKLQIKSAGSNLWKTIAEEKIIVPGWTVPFRIKNWDSRKDYKYRLVYSMVSPVGQMKEYYYTGNVNHNPTDKNIIVAAAFTGNGATYGTFGKNYSFTRANLWFPQDEIVRNLKEQKPDLLVFTGDQIYETSPTVPDRSGSFNSYLDYMYKWYLFCWAYTDLFCDIPTVCMPDDHDVYQGNIWGNGGVKPPNQSKGNKYPDYYKGENAKLHWRQDKGGYIMPTSFVNMVQRTQTSQLPDPYDPTPIASGIGVYYTSMNYGGISFAILEDRKFKSSPVEIMPKGDVVNGWFQNSNFDPREADMDDAKLLGDRQLSFLHHWTADWRGAWMKISLSQTILADVTTQPIGAKSGSIVARRKPLPPGVMPKNFTFARDIDSNGWPQTGRNKALRELRRGFTFMIAGDQHLASIVHHGIDNWDDAGFSFCVPSVGNMHLRMWYPPKPGIDHQPGYPPYTGKYLDGFGNHITVWAAANPVISYHKPAELYDRAPGYGLLLFNKKQQTITMQCWPRYVDPADPNAKEFPGWPMTISVEDNYGRKADAYLPTLKFTGMKNPVVQVIKESNNQVLYTIRAKDDTFRAKVFEPGLYTIKTGEQGTSKMKTLKHIHSISRNESKTIILAF